MLGIECVGTSSIGLTTLDRVLELIGTKTLLDSLQCVCAGGVVCMTGILGGDGRKPREREDGGGRRAKPLRSRSMEESLTLEIRVFGVVQGVGFRPTVWRLARERELVGDVRNDASGVRIRVAGSRPGIEGFIAALHAEAPPLSRIDRLLAAPLDEELSGDFRIVESTAGETRTHVAPDASVCRACIDETLNPAERRFRYPFTNCTHCGPRFSIVREVPYDRARTSMGSFEMCPACAAEYGDPADRRFHAQPIACHECGPKAWLVPTHESASSPIDVDSDVDAVERVAELLRLGEIVAIRGIGGFHLACDATRADVVERLRARKRRDAKPFALMARELSVIERYCQISDEEAELLTSPEAPIVLLRMRVPCELPETVAPGLDTLGFMLPYTPLHRLLMQNIDKPLVMTSANLTDAPQVTKNEEALHKLSGVADFALLHDRDIVNRIDDSVVRLTGRKPRILRRARGYAPGAVALPDGFERAPEMLAFGGELKSTFCLIKDGAAILSQHQGDLEDLETYDDYVKNLALYRDLYEHTPEVLVADKHPDYVSTKLARSRAAADDLPLVEVQHHHAHIAACLAENQVPLDAPPVLGVALDGLGYGEDGTLWGGEFMVADYARYRRLGTFKPVRMLGGAQAIRQPWRSLYAHLMTGIGWSQVEQVHGGLELVRWLAAQPRTTLDCMLTEGLNSPVATSCGRLFDAVAAALGLCRERARFEAEGAMRLEAIVDREVLDSDGHELAYPFELAKLPDSDMRYVEPLPMWWALLEDLAKGTPRATIAARFHAGLSEAIVAMVAQIFREHEVPGERRVALTGGCFQNAILSELVTNRLTENGFSVLSHSQIPTNDGGLALGQAAVAAGLHLKS